MKRVAGFYLAGLVILTCLALFIKERFEDVATHPRDPREPGVVREARTPGSGEVQQVESIDQRAAVPESRRIRILDGNGTPVVGANVQLLIRSVPSAPDAAISGSGGSTDRLANVEQLRSDDFGYVSLDFSAPDSFPQGWVVVAAPGFEIGVAPIAAPVDGGVCTIHLRPQSLEVAVFEPGDQPSLNADVQIARSLWLREGSERFEVPISFSYQTGVDGIVRLPYGEGWAVQAQKSNLSSIQVQVHGQDRINLTLQATFFLRFNKIGADFLSEQLRYQVCALIGAATVVVGAGSVSSNQQSVTVAVPLTGAPRYLVFCAGHQSSSRPVDVQMPEAGRTYEVPITLGGSRKWTTKVVDGAGRPVSNAEVRCCWLDRDGVSRWISTTSDDNGMAGFASLPDSAVWFVATKPGYFQRYSVDEWTQYPREQETLITLESSQELIGHVDGLRAPSKGFCIWYAPEGSGWTAEYFDGATDGDFKLVGVPTGSVELIAVASDGIQSEIVRGTVPQPQGQTLRLGLAGSTGPGRCVVVDADTGLPVEGVEAELLVQAGGSVIGGSGSKWRGGPQGVVEVPAMCVGTSRIRIDAPGYESVTVSGYGVEGLDVDFGQVRLRRVGALLVRIIPDGPLRLDWCSIAIYGSMAMPRTLFSNDGTVEYPAVSSGSLRIEILRADAIEEVVQLELPYTERGTVDIPISVQQEMAVLLSPSLTLRASGAEFIYNSPEGWLRRTFAPSNGKSRINVPVSPQLVEEIEIQAEDMSRLVRRQVTADERSSALVTIEECEACLIRVLGPNRVPASGASVLVRRPGGDDRRIIDSRTDDDGMARFRGLGWDQVDVLVFHPQIGVRPSERVDLKELAGRTLELELNPVGRARVAVKDREVAIAGVQVRFLDPKYNAGRAMTDEEGVAWSLPLQEGKYRAEVGQSGYWPAVLDFECDKEEVWTTLQVRRTGGLDLEIQSASARDPRSFLIELRSKEFETPVSTWLGAGKVVSPQGGRPDKDGRLEIYGLPNGEYAWTAILDGAGVMAGEIEVGPHTVNKKKLFLP